MQARQRAGQCYVRLLQSRAAGAGGNECTTNGMAALGEALQTAGKHSSNLVNIAALFAPRVQPTTYDGSRGGSKGVFRACLHTALATLGQGTAQHRRSALRYTGTVLHPLVRCTAHAPLLPSRQLASSTGRNAHQPCLAHAAGLGSLSVGSLGPNVRHLTSTSAQQQQQQHPRDPEATKQQQQQQQQQPGYDSLELTQERINAITDKIPQRPVGVVEGTSYTIIILAAFGVLAFVLYHFVVNFILEPTALQCFNTTLDLLKADPRVTVRLGATEDIRAWGSNSTSRVARQQIPHQIYKDASGTEHVRIQFYMRGPSGTGLVNADMYKDAAGKWAYTYLLIDVYANNSNTPSRVYVIKP